ncbi:MAG: ABC transporter permease subunit, partial [Pseudomonas sp.]
MSVSANPARYRAWLACTPLLLVSALLLGVPFLVSALRSVVVADAFDLSAYAGLLDSSFLAVLGRSLGFAGLVALGCLLLGVPTAHALVRFPPAPRRLLLVAIGTSFLAGTLIRSYAWLAIFGAHGLVNTIHHWLGGVQPLHLAFTYGSMLLAGIQVELPLFVLPLYAVMRQLDPRLERAARNLGADPVTAWFTVVLPQALPGLASATLLVFLTAMSFFAIPALLGPPDTYLLSQELEVRINTLGDNAGASARIVVMMLLVAGAAALWAAGRRGLSAVGRQVERGRVMDGLVLALQRAAAWVSPWRQVPVWGGCAISFVLLVVPVLVIAPLGVSDDAYLHFPPSAFSLRWAEHYLGDPDLLESTGFSLWIGSAAALLSTAIGALAALALGRLGPRARTLVTLAALAPLVVSPMSMTASLYLLALQWSWLGPAALFVAVYTVMGLPYGFLLVGAAAARLDPRL